jgi:sugar O-acyltransferase (sialic acid O-acetyltransferase NeuD family)
MKPIAIYGAGGFGLEVAMLIEQINEVKPQWNIVGFFDDNITNGTRKNDYCVLGGIKHLNNWSEKLAIVFALGMPKIKKKVVDKVKNPNLYFPSLIHPSAIIGSKKYVQIGQGCIISAGCIITTNIKIGSFVFFNLSCTFGHESKIGDFCSFMHGCNISGEVSIGEISFWGTGAKIINRKTVGSNTTIGAGAVVVDNVPPNVTVVGVPAKPLKQKFQPNH